MENKTFMNPEIPTSAEKTLTNIAYLVLVLGILGGFVLAMASLAMQSGYLFGVAAATVLSCVLTWASMHVFANISLRLKAIQDVMCQKNMVTETNGEQMAIENSKVEEVKPQIKKF